MRTMRNTSRSGGRNDFLINRLNRRNGNDSKGRDEDIATKISSSLLNRSSTTNLRSFSIALSTPQLQLFHI